MKSENAAGPCSIPKDAISKTETDLDVSNYMRRTQREKEVLEAVKKITENKALGLDGIFSKTRKAALKIALNIYAEASTTCFQEGVFPTYWKKQKLMLIPRSNKAL